MEDIDVLFSAVATNDADCVRAITSAHPERARASNTDSLPVLVFARYMGDADVLDTLLSAGPPLDGFEAAQIDDVRALRQLLDASPELVFAYSGDGFTALHFAAYYGAPAAMRLLLDRGANVEAVTKNFLTNMPIHAAAAAAVGHLEPCEILLERGADVNARQHGGNTPLHTAGFRGDRALAELLLQHGAAPAAKNDEGQTAAGIASSHGFSQLAALLRAHESAA
jgi:ankyrin repeat protein